VVAWFATVFPHKSHRNGIAATRSAGWLNLFLQSARLRRTLAYDFRLFNSVACIVTLIGRFIDSAITTDGTFFDRVRD